MLETLFSSRVRVKVLEALMTDPSAEHHSRSLARLTGERQNAVWRELQKLEAAGLVHGETHGKRKTYSLCREYPLYSELRRLILKAKGEVPQPHLTPDVHERYSMPDCVIACQPDYVVGEND
jgi:hypothetical protein